jgi:hypothetical protein
VPHITNLLWLGIWVAAVCLFPTLPNIPQAPSHNLTYYHHTFAADSRISTLYSYSYLASLVSQHGLLFSSYNLQNASTTKQNITNGHLNSAASRPQPATLSGPEPFTATTVNNAARCQSSKSSNGPGWTRDGCKWNFLCWTARATPVSNNCGSNFMHIVTNSHVI